MASRAGKAAALASIGRDIPNIFSTVLGTYRSGIDRKEAQKDRELDRELTGYQMEGVKKDLTAKDLQNQLTGMNVEQKKAGADALRQFYESLDDEKKLAELKDLTAKNIAKLDDKEKSFTDADTNLAEITTQAKPENFEQKRRDIAERFQFVNPEAQGLMTGIKQKDFPQLETSKFINVDGTLYAVESWNIKNRAGHDDTNYILKNVDDGSMITVNAMGAQF